MLILSVMLSLEKMDTERE